MTDEKRPNYGPARSYTGETSETRAMRDLARELRRQREDRMRDEYRDVHPSEWPVEHPDWGSSRFEPWGGPKWHPPRKGGPPKGTGLELDDIRAELAADPDATQEAVAAKLGTTDRRIRQILKDARTTWQDVRKR